MKRYGNIYEYIYSMDNLMFAHKMASKGKAHYREVKMVNKNPEKYLRYIQQHLIDGTFTTSEYIFKEIFDGGKTRLLSKLPYFPDRIVHWAIMLQTDHIFMRSFIDHSYAAIKGRGPHKMVHDIRNFIANNADMYFMKVDIHKFFPSINGERLKEKLDRTFKDKKLIGLFANIVDSHEGLPIGSYTSQYLGNFYLNDVDYFLQKLKLHPFRYMDDIVVFGESKAVLLDGVHEAKALLAVDKLKLKDELSFGKVGTDVLDIVGYGILSKSIVQVRKKIKMNIHRDIERKNVKSLSSYNGWLQHSTCRRLQQRVMEELYAV